MFSMYRGFLTVRDPGAVADDRAHARRCSSHPSSRCRSSRGSSFPSSDRPELLVDLTPAAERLDLRQRDAWRGASTTSLKDDPDVERWSTYVGPRRHPLLPAAQRPAAERFLRPGGDRRQGRRGARAAAGEARRRCWPTNFPSVVGRVSPLELGPPVGWPVQYRVSGPDIAQVREIAFKLAQVVASEPAGRAGQLRLDRAGAPGAHPRSTRTRRGCWA